MNTPRLVAHFGSLRTMLVLTALLAAVVLLRPERAFLAPAIGALAACLAAALVVHPRLRRQWPLLVAHLALLALVLLAGAGRLLALDGHFELTQGEPFDGTLLGREAGAWHAERLRSLSFRHDGFEIDYAPGRKRGATRNTVTWLDGDGRAQQAVIGDHRPLVLDGHRFYTSPNKGFAPILEWTPAGGQPVAGAVHLPSFPSWELRQWREWTPPGGRGALWTQLRFDETLIDPEAPSRFRMPREPRMVVVAGARRAELAPGEAVQLPEGTLRFVELRTWMGYRVAYDPTLPALLVTALVAALALALHYALAFRRPRSAAAAPASPLHPVPADG